MWNAIALMTKCMLTVRTRDLSVRNSRLENENVVAFGAFAACLQDNEIVGINMSRARRTNVKSGTHQLSSISTCSTLKRNIFSSTLARLFGENTLSSCLDE